MKITRSIAASLLLLFAFFFPFTVFADTPPEEEVFLTVEKPATFNGGDILAFRKWVMGEIVYPQTAAESNIEGTVVVFFVVEKDGAVSNIEVLDSPDQSLTDEVVRVVSGSPTWSPGIHQGATVRMGMTLPVVFKLESPREVQAVPLPYENQTEQLKFYHLSQGETGIVRYPAFKGDDLCGWVTENIEWPVEMPQGRLIRPLVNVAFLVDADGNVTQTKVLNSYSEEASDQLVRVIELSGWEPALRSVPGASEDAMPVATPLLMAIGYEFWGNPLDRMPEFQGGDLTIFRKWVIERIQYPPMARDNGIQGTVVVTFVIDVDGSVVDLTVVNKPDPMLATEAVRVIRRSPKWTPGYQKGKDGQFRPVKVKFTLPVNFAMH